MEKWVPVHQDSTGLLITTACLIQSDKIQYGRKFIKYISVLRLGAEQKRMNGLCNGGYKQFLMSSDLETTWIRVCFYFLCLTILEFFFFQTWFFIFKFIFRCIWHGEQWESINQRYIIWKKWKTYILITLLIFFLMCML